MPSAPPDSGRPRRPRRPASEIRSLMLDAGVEIVMRDGFVLDIAGVSFEDVVRASGAPRTTAYRLWPHRAAYFVDLLDALFGGEGQAPPVRGFDEETFATVSRVMAAMSDSMETEAGRREVLREVSRQGLARNLEAVTGSVPWRAYRSAISAVTSGTFADDEENILRAGLKRIEEGFLDRMADAFTDLAAAFRRDFLPGITARDIAVVTAAIVEGIVERKHLLDPAIGDVRVVREKNGSEREWNLAAIAIHAEFVALTEERRQ